MMIDNPQPEKFPVQSTRKNAWTDKYFTPLTCMLMANIFDLLGRTTATWLQWPKRSLKGQTTLLVVVLLRIAIIPMFMLCNVAPEVRRLPVIFYSDTVYCILIILLAFSVGYFGNLCLIHAPKTHVLAEYQEATSLILTACYVLGQATGSSLSYFILQAI